MAKTKINLDINNDFQQYIKVSIFSVEMKDVEILNVNLQKFEDRLYLFMINKFYPGGDRSLRYSPEEYEIVPQDFSQFEFNIMRLIDQFFFYKKSSMIIDGVRENEAQARIDSQKTDLLLAYSFYKENSQISTCFVSDEEMKNRMYWENFWSTARTSTKITLSLGSWALSYWIPPLLIAQKTMFSFVLSYSSINALASVNEKILNSLIDGKRGRELISSSLLLDMSLGALSGGYRGWRAGTVFFNQLNLHRIHSMALVTKTAASKTTDKATTMLINDSTTNLLPKIGSNVALGSSKEGLKDILEEECDVIDDLNNEERGAIYAAKEDFRAANTDSFDLQQYKKIIADVVDSISDRLDSFSPNGNERRLLTIQLAEIVVHSLDEPLRIKALNCLSRTLARCNIGSDNLKVIANAAYSISVHLAPSNDQIAPLIKKYIEYFSPSAFREIYDCEPEINKVQLDAILNNQLEHSETYLGVRVYGENTCNSYRLTLFNDVGYQLEIRSEKATTLAP